MIRACMPLDLRFASADLRDICERRATAERMLGVAPARKLRARIADIRAASDIRQVLLGRPTLSARGRVTFVLSPTHRLVLASAISPIPRGENREVDWCQVNIFEVVEIS
jgi:toxin HigB-1